MGIDPERLQTIANRDQLWASLRQLLPEIDEIADGRFTASAREQEILQLLARVVSAELGFRADEAQT